MRKLLFILLFFISSEALASGLFDFLKNPDKPKTAKRYTVQSVIDGDTIILENNEKVRYLGIDAPETHKKVGDSWSKVSEPFGEEATLFNKSLVEHKEVTLKFDREKEDQYGRTLAYVYVDNRLVNTAILAEGLAFPYDIHKLKLYSVFRLAFMNALKSRRGLYKTVFTNTRLHEQVGLQGWYVSEINFVYYGTDKTVVKTDYVDIHLIKKGLRIKGLKRGNRGYFYGRLTRKKDRYILLVENAHHVVIE